MAITRTKILWGLLAVIVVVWMSGALDKSGPPQNATAPTSADRVLNDCFRKTFNGRAFEITQPLQPQIRFYSQLSSEDDMHKSVWLIVNACPHEAAAWDEQCRASGIDATTCVINSGDLARQAIDSNQRGGHL
ncbi:MAG: hypothetical protein ACYDCM_12300 [Candidatus Acidiferrales bacterium]